MNGLHLSAVNWPLAASALTSRKRRARMAEAADHRDDEVAGACLGAWSVEQHAHFGTHRFTASRRDNVVKRIPRGSVKITNPAAMIPKMT